MFKRGEQALPGLIYGLHAEMDSDADPGLPNPATIGVEDWRNGGEEGIKEDYEEETTNKKEGEVSPPWNLKKRRAVCKALITDSDGNQYKEKGLGEENGVRPKFNSTLSKKEVEVPETFRDRSIEVTKDIYDIPDAAENGKDGFKERSDLHERTEEDGCTTPRSGKYRIPVSSVCPPPPRRKSKVVTVRSRDPPRNGYFQPPDLEVLFYAQPRREAAFT
ncbi:hypothetical protein Bca4012_024832 [Brassica carinata]